MYPQIRLTLSPNDQVSIQVSDGDGNPHLSFDPQLQAFIRVLADDVDLDELVHSTKWEVREAVARHQNVTAEHLAILSGDPVREVRTAAVRNPKFPYSQE